MVIITATRSSSQFGKSSVSRSVWAQSQLPDELQKHPGTAAKDTHQVQAKRWEIVLDSPKQANPFTSWPAGCPAICRWLCLGLPSTEAMN